MFYPKLHLRSFSAGCALLVGSIGVLSAESWEETVPPFAPGSFPELRPVKVQYGFGWNGVTAATADLHLTKTPDEHYRLEATGRTVGFARNLWKFDVAHVGLSDARTLRPIQIREVESVRSKRWETVVDYTSQGVVSRREEQSGSSIKTKERVFKFPNVLSLNSALLYVRAKPLPDGAVERIVVYPTTSAYLCTITVLGRESLTVAAGSYEAIKLDVQLNKIGKKRELQTHKKFKRATVWLGNDADRLVLRIETQIFIGTVFAELQSVQFDSARPEWR